MASLSVRILFSKYSTFFFLLIILSACSAGFRSPTRPQRRRIETDRLQQAARRWLHTPYRLGGSDSTGVDCSALVQHIYRDVYGLNLPRSTHGQRRLGFSVAFAYLRSGDLLFFRMRPSGPLDHVGVYLGQGRFVHASSSRGVVISSLNDPFYRRHFVTARRVRH